MIAALPMYDRPETRAANDRFWQLIRGKLIDQQVDAPTQLTRDVDPWDVWLHKDLVLAQTCGLPYRTRLHDKVALVGTPICDLDCADGHYFSVIVARRGSNVPNEPCVAINDDCSQSGWAALVSWLDGRTVSAISKTGAHVLSAKAVAEGNVDLAAIDAVTWGMIKKWEPWAEHLHVIGHSNSTPTLPFITSLGTDKGAVFHAIDHAMTEMSAEDRKLLCLRGVTRISAKDYLAVPTPPPPPI